MENRKVMAISGINLFEGGALSVYKDCLSSMLKSGVLNQYHVIAFVHRKEIFQEFVNEIEIVEIPNARKNYLYRFYYEYIFFYFYSCRRKIHIWFSIHDITPNVKADKRYVYCHNAAPFLKKTKTVWKYSKTVYLMSVFYKYIYKIHIKCNSAVIVQQNWIREEFKHMFGVRNVIVAKPNVTVPESMAEDGSRKEKKSAEKIIFIYAAFPRVFKNYEVICKAAELLEDIEEQFEVWLTIDGSENKYSRDIKNRYSRNSSIKWLGLMERNVLSELYQKSDCMIFPSLLETWGLPITEYKATGNPIIMADLKYAHETVGTYGQAVFFEPQNESRLAELMRNMVNGNMRTHEVKAERIEEPFADSWETLWELLVRDGNER